MSCKRCDRVGVGDRGQRYEVRCRDWETGDDMCVGWADDPAGLVASVNANPSMCDPVVIDRHANKGDVI